MPDWSYHTIFKPWLFRLSAPQAKALILRAVSLLGAIPGGQALISFMGHMTPSSELVCESGGIKFPTRVGLGCGITEGRPSIRAFERFGFGFLELGPVTATPCNIGGKLERNDGAMSVIGPDAPGNEGLSYFISSHLPDKPASLPIFVRVAHPAGTTSDAMLTEAIAFQDQLPSWIAAIVIDSRWCVTNLGADELDSYLNIYITGGRKILVSLTPDTSSADRQRILESAMRTGATGVSIVGGSKDLEGTRVYGRPTYAQALQLVADVRAAVGADKLIVGSGGIIEPLDALTMLAAGANIIQLYSGFVFSGPGLPKRINELITCAQWQHGHKPDPAPPPLPFSLTSVLNCGWIGIALVGLSLLITGSSAITVALTTVILPYDESFLGVTRAALMKVNPNLLPFMSHDRVTYAGAGMSCGLLFASLSAFGARRGQSWAYIAACVSCAFGFLSFLLFLGFHYLDPLHALATLLMLPMFIWGLVKKPTRIAMRSSNSRNTQSWYNSLWGQFWFVCIGAGLVLAGITICKVGTSTVFVNEDLMFMKTTAQALLCHNDHLLPAIAHDRAGFGGTLVTAGLAVLLSGLYGFRQGEGWVWWMLLISGLPGFLSTLGIHYAIGYTNWFHLLPAYIATAMFAAGLSLSYRYMCLEPGPDTVAELPDPGPTVKPN